MKRALLRVTRTGFVLAALLLAPVTLAHAAGVNLSWDACGSEGAGNKGFACDANTGANFSLFCSVVPPEGTTAVTGVEVTVDVVRCFELPPDWWQFVNAGACRRTAVLASADFTAMDSQVCADYWAGQAQAMLASYNVQMVYGVYGRGRLTAIAAVLPGLAGPLDPSLEYAILRLTFTRVKTTGAGACAGCLQPVGIYLTQVLLSQPVGVGDFRVTQMLDRSSVGWQMNSVPGWMLCGDPVRNNTWGGIKALYR